jgi:hypothetical protein
MRHHVEAAGGSPHLTVANSTWCPDQFPKFDQSAREKYMGDITERFHGGDLFSRLASKRTKRERDIPRIKTWMIDRGRHGATSYECSVALNIRHQTCSARFTDLKTEEYGCFLVELLNQDGKQVSRPTDTGSPAGVWIANPRFSPAALDGQTTALA